MTATEIIQNIPGDQLCFSVKEFGAAMGAAQGQVIASAVQAMTFSFLIGVVVGGIIVYLWIKTKQKIDGD